jgi:hypothetical protein
LRRMARKMLRLNKTTSLWLSVSRRSRLRR